MKLINIERGMTARRALIKYNKKNKTSFRAVHISVLISVFKYNSASIDVSASRIYLFLRDNHKCIDHYSLNRVILELLAIWAIEKDFKGKRKYYKITLGGRNILSGLEKTHRSIHFDHYIKPQR